MDELHKLQSFDQFFGKMQISKKQKQERIELSEDIEDLMIVLFVLLPREENIEELKAIFKRDLKETVSNRMPLDDELTTHLDKTIDEVVDTTIKNMDGDDYWLSEDRAKVIAVNETNTSYNHYEYVLAIESGYTQKQWLTELDDKVRPTHTEVDGETIPIDDLFVVGNSFMLYPMDTTYDAEAKEIINCRCTCVYI